MNRGPSGWLLYGGLFLALLLMVVPLPDGMDLARPYVLAMLLCYWLLETPDRVGLGTAFIAGLAADLVAGGAASPTSLRLLCHTLRQIRYFAVAGNIALVVILYCLL